jgi:hypothetical protein
MGRYYLQATRGAILVHGWEVVVARSRGFSRTPLDGCATRAELDRLLDPDDTGRPAPVAIRYFFEDLLTVVIPYRDDDGVLFILWMMDNEQVNVDTLPCFDPEGLVTAR